MRTLQKKADAITKRQPKLTALFKRLYEDSVLGRITILRHYIDRAFSAKTDNRPEFQNMIKDSGKRLFDMVIVWNGWGADRGAGDADNSKDYE